MGTVCEGGCDLTRRRFNAESSMPRKNSVVEWAGKPQRHFDAKARKKNAPRNGGMAACKATLRCCDEESTSADGFPERRHWGGGE